MLQKYHSASSQAGENKPLLLCPTSPRRCLTFFLVEHAETHAIHHRYFPSSLKTTDDSVSHVCITQMSKEKGALPFWVWSRQRGHGACGSLVGSWVKHKEEEMKNKHQQREKKKQCIISEQLAALEHVFPLLCTYWGVTFCISVALSSLICFFGRSTDWLYDLL